MGDQTVSGRIAALVAEYGDKRAKIAAAQSNAASNQSNEVAEASEQMPWKKAGIRQDIERFIRDNPI